MANRVETQSALMVASAPFAALDMFTGVLPEFKLPQVMPDIVTFATSPQFCGKTLYPRQQTILRIVMLEIENLTEYDNWVIDQWIESSKKFDSGGEVLIPIDIRERMQTLRDAGRTHFREFVDVGGRRGGKGYLGGIIGAYLTYEKIMLDDPQDYYGIDKSKDLYINIVATSTTQARKYLFSDVAASIMDCAALTPYIWKVQEEEVRIQTPADIRKFCDMRHKGVKVNKDLASIRITANAATGQSGRGGAAFMQAFDEFAHLAESDSTRSASEVYEAYTPSLDQIGFDAFIYVPSSPYCLEPSTRVLTEDLRWVPVGALKVGDALIGFDEYNPSGKGNGRSWRRSEVTETSVITAPRFELTTESGKRIVCTGEHMWLARKISRTTRAKTNFEGSYPHGYEWIRTSDMVAGDLIKSIGDVWETEDSREAGYLAGFFDGEGHFSQQRSLGFTQNDGDVYRSVVDSLTARGFDIRDGAKSHDSNIRKAYVNGGLPEQMRFLGSIRPRRLLAGFPEKLYGSRIYGNKKGGVDPSDKVVSVRQIEDGEVVALGTSTETLIAEGLLSHNTKVGKFADLYEAGLAMDADGKAMYPEMLVFQHPSWSLYEDWQYNPTIRRPIQQYDKQMMQLEQRNPQKFKVERRARFAETVDAYLDPEVVDKMFKPIEVIDPDGSVRERNLVNKMSGQWNHVYRFHADPSKAQCNFAVAGGHSEIFPDGLYHAIIDYIRVYQPKDFPNDPVTGLPWVDYTQIEEDILNLTKLFPMSEFSFDQFNSVSSIQKIRTGLSQRGCANPQMIVRELTFTKQVNWNRCEMFKTAAYMGLIHLPVVEIDYPGTGAINLAEQELKFLREVNGRVDKQTAGAILTKDLADCIMTVAVELLAEQMSDLIGGEFSNKTMVGAARGGYTMEGALQRIQQPPIHNSLQPQIGTGLGGSFEQLYRRQGRTKG